MPLVQLLNESHTGATRTTRHRDLWQAIMTERFADEMQGDRFRVACAGLDWRYLEVDLVGGGCSSGWGNYGRSPLRPA